MSFDKKYFFGLDEVSASVNPGNDKGLKNEYIAHYANAFNCKTVRIWLRTNEIIKIAEGDKIEFIAEGLLNLHNYLEALRKKGVERFLLLDWAFVYPYGYRATDRNVVPDPKKEPEMYKRFILLQQRVRFEIASNFTLIDYFESTNEPESDGGPFFHKNGYHLNGENNEDYIFTKDEVQDIILDLNYYENLGVKMANKDAKMLLPSFCNLGYAPQYLDEIYKKIESGKYPTFGAVKSDRIDSFFEILNWHPYNLISIDINDDWFISQEKIREVILKHSDGDRPVWYTEAGWSDAKREAEKNIIGKRFIDLFNAVNERLPWVETIFLFRLFNLSNRPESEGEDNFGLVYNEYDWYNPLFPKPASIDIYRYINGENAPLDALYKFSKVNERELFPYINIKKGNNTFSVLVLGNHIAYQRKAPWNNFNESRGLGSSKADNDFVHVLFRKLNNKHPDLDMTVIDMRNWERCCYYEDFYKELNKFKNKKYDLIIVRLGENVISFAFNDYPFKEHLLKLCNFFKEENTKYIFTSVFDNNLKINPHNKEVAETLSAPYIDFENMRHNYEYVSKDKYINNEYKILPNDLGMEIIADSIFKKC